MLRPVKVKALSGFRIWIAYEDGVNGEIDLSDIAGKGVFKAWEELGVFEKVYISPRRTIAWNDDLDICADALYLELTGKSVEDVFPNLKSLTQV
ncbi:MAG: DUF2442 domain-containing protein [Chloroflexi bacterium]|nr:DUF2442 domain-containing protein [Chloroflexota bacterium]